MAESNSSLSVLKKNGPGKIMKRYRIKLFNTLTNSEYDVIQESASVLNYYFLERFPVGNNFFVLECYEVV